MTIDSGASIDTGAPSGSLSARADERPLFSSQGAPHPLELAFERYASSLVRYLYASTFDPYLAQDLLSDVFESALRRIDTYEERGYPLLSWLYVIAHSRVVDYYRQQRARAEVPLDDVDAASGDPSERAVWPDEAAALRAAVAALPAQQRQVILLRFYEDMAIPDVAARLSITPGAVKARQHRALKRLRAMLAPPPPAEHCIVEGCRDRIHADGRCAFHHARRQTLRQ